MASESGTKGMKFTGEKPSLLLYGGVGLIALFKDLLDLAFIGSLPGIGTIITLCLSFLIWMLLTVFDRSSKGTKGNMQIARGLVVIFFGLVEAIGFGLNFLPIQTAMVFVLYVLARRAWKKAQKEHEKKSAPLKSTLRQERLRAARQAKEVRTQREEPTVQTGEPSQQSTESSTETPPSLAPRLMNDMKLPENTVVQKEQYRTNNTEQSSSEGVVTSGISSETTYKNLQSGSSTVPLLQAVSHIETKDNFHPEITSSDDRVQKKQEEIYQQALSKADSIIAEAEQRDIKNPSLGTMPPSSARLLLNEMKWNRSYVDPNNTDEAPLRQVPDTVKEAQRLVFNTYTPTASMESLQGNAFTQVVEKRSSQLDQDIQKWQSPELENREIVLQDYARELSSSFGIHPPIEIVFSDNSGKGVEAAHVFGTGKILWPISTLKSKTLFQSLEIVAHEVNHANQEALMSHKATLPDVEWFVLAKERESFIPVDEFKGRGDGYSKKSNYLSIPQEKDSFNAQNIFKAILNKKSEEVLNKKLSDLHLPSLTLAKDMQQIASLYDLLGDSITEADIKSIDLSQAGKAYIDSHRGKQNFVPEICAEATKISQSMEKHFKDVF